jgi:hypothetical protein
MDVPPLLPGGVVLEEEMVLAILEDQAVGIVDPALPGREVELRPKVLTVHRHLTPP